MVWQQLIALTLIRKPYQFIFQFYSLTELYSGEGLLKVCCVCRNQADCIKHLPTQGSVSPVNHGRNGASHVEIVLTSTADLIL